MVTPMASTQDSTGCRFCKNHKSLLICNHSPGIREIIGYMMILKLTHDQLGYMTHAWRPTMLMKSCDQERSYMHVIL